MRCEKRFQFDLELLFQMQEIKICSFTFEEIVDHLKGCQDCLDFAAEKFATALTLDKLSFFELSGDCNPFEIFYEMKAAKETATQCSSIREQIRSIYEDAYKSFTLDPQSRLEEFLKNGQSKTELA